jgi:hypothetical protein
VSLVLLAGWSGPALGQGWAVKMFEATSHDFGRVPRASTQQFRFKFKNLYKEDVHVAGVRVSCGCISATVSQPDLKTFETGEIIADFNTRSFLGHRNATITVTFDQPFFAEVRLQIEGYIRSDVVFDPPLVELGTIDQGTAVERKIAVHYAGRADWEIKDVTSASTYFEVVLSPPKREPGRTDYELTVRLKPDAPVGHINDQLNLVTNDRRSTRIPLYVSGQVQSEVTVSPAALLLGDVTAGQQVTKTLIVRGRKPFRIASIDGGESAKFFEFKLPPAPATLHRVTVTFTAGEKPGKLLQTLKVLAEGSPTTVVAQCQVHATIVSPATTTASN